MKFRMMVLVVCILGSAGGCDRNSGSPEGWVPALEETGFGYLSATAEQVQGALAEAEDHLAAGDSAAARESLAAARGSLGILLRFDLPMTEVRQLIYDADRLYALDREQEMGRRLDRAAEMLAEIKAKGNPAMHQAAAEILIQLEELKILLAESGSSRAASRQAAAVTETFQELGHAVNLLILKSGLLFSAEDFGSGDQGAGR